MGSPPLTRGIRKQNIFVCEFTGITPAYAGNTNCKILRHDVNWYHPRLRGEYIPSKLHLERILGSPPLTRGIQLMEPFVSVGVRITPAYAGNTRRNNGKHHITWDHPRLRGEYTHHVKVSFSALGSPPLTRGIPALSGAHGEIIRITPAYAGNTNIQSLPFLNFRDHPRLRGEY